MRAMISRKRCKSRGARNIRRRHPGNFQNFLGWTQRLQARQSTCICFDFKSLRLRSRALQSLPSAAIMSSNALENGVPNEEIWWKWWLPHILPGSSWFFPPVPGSPACACQQWLVVSASWLQSANRSQESRHRRWVPSCTKPGKDLHHSKGLDILIELLNYKLSYHWVQILPARVLWGISNSTNFISLHLALHAAKTCQDHEGQRHVKIWDETKDSGGMEPIERKLPYICYIIYTYTNTRYIYNVYTEYNVWCIYIIFIYIYIL